MSTPCPADNQKMSKTSVTFDFIVVVNDPPIRFDDVIKSVNRVDKTYVLAVGKIPIAETNIFVTN